MNQNFGAILWRSEPLLSIQHHDNSPESNLFFNLREGDTELEAGKGI
jgi:hypothetical protein